MFTITRRAHKTPSITAFRSHGLSPPFAWPRLRTLVLKVETRSFPGKVITDTITFLKEFPHSTLEDVRIQLDSDAMPYILLMLSSKDTSQQIAELDQVLVRFPRPQVACNINYLRNGRHSFWMRRLGEHFPAVFQRGAFAITSGTGLRR